MWLWGAGAVGPAHGSFPALRSGCIESNDPARAGGDRLFVLHKGSGVLLLDSV